MEACAGRAAESAAAHLARMWEECVTEEEAHVRGLVETVAGHLVELWAVRLLGAERIYEQLSVVAGDELVNENMKYNE